MTLAPTGTRRALPRLFLGLATLCALTASTIATTPSTLAGSNDPPSCNGLIQKYFQSNQPNGSSTSFTLVTDELSEAATYAEGRATLANPTGLVIWSTLKGTGTRYFSTKRFNRSDVFDDDGDPFDPNATTPVNVSIRYLPSPVDGRQLLVFLTANTISQKFAPSMCIGNNMLVATNTEALSIGSPVIVLSLGPLTSPAAPPN